MAPLSVKDDYERYLSEHHRPAHGRRTAERWAAHLLPHLRPGMRLLDLGCGPGSITVGLGDGVDKIGIDLAPVRIDGVPVASANGAALPFAASSFDAIFANAVLQHVATPLALLREARRVARPGAVIGLGDADWDGILWHPRDPLLVRGYELRERLREGGSVRVGRLLRGLLTEAGFERAEVSVVGNAVGTAESVFWNAAFEASWFEAEPVIAYLTELGLSDAAEMAAIAAAWKRWGDDPSSVSATMWFRALAWAPT
jgi:SAM-dependent methyltransferase